MKDKSGITRTFTSVHNLVFNGQPNTIMHAIQRRKRYNFPAWSHISGSFPIRLQIDTFS